MFKANDEIKQTNWGTGDLYSIKLSWYKPQKRLQKGQKYSRKQLWSNFLDHSKEKILRNNVIKDTIAKTNEPFLGFYWFILPIIWVKHWGKLPFLTCAGPNKF